jgi:(4-(4-[2-(gamma-L-glutamylamino)ethyl]phenoxymethyl)furan-2-yl)methanamine synthase
MPVSRSPAQWVGWDLGGAHLKAVRLDATGVIGAVVQVPCPLWQGLDRLEESIDRVLSALGDTGTRHAVTMTGELVDLFDDRPSGVRTLVAAMQQRFPSADLKVFAGFDGLLDPVSAVAAASQVASANWMATASFLASRLPAGLLVDVGSTTTDLVPFRAGRVSARGYTDHERLEQEELVYTGVVRTPLMSLGIRAPWEGRWVPLMAEQFATTADVYRLTGDLPNQADVLPSADGREKTPSASARRLGRMVGLDAVGADLPRWRRMASFFAERQLRIVADACDRVLSRDLVPDNAPLVGAGVGRFVARRLAERLQRPYVAFESFFRSASGDGGFNVGDCAPAAAVGSLAAGDAFR